MKEPSDRMQHVSPGAYTFSEKCLLTLPLKGWNPDILKKVNFGGGSKLELIVGFVIHWSRGQ